MEDFKSNWRKCLEIIKDNIGDDRFQSWFECSRAVAYEDNCLTLQLPSAFFVEIYESTFYDILKHSLRRVFGDKIRLDYTYYVVKDDADTKVRLESPRQSHVITNKNLSATRAEATPFASPTFQDVDPQLNPVYNFENYCVGQSNHLPFVIAEFIANHPDKTQFNPFFLYGSVGVGKTHLIQAIGIRIKEKTPAAKVLYVTYRQFQNQYSSAYLNHKIPDFIKWYEQIDVLLIDDVQEISGKVGTMNALYPIFNYLHQRGKKIVFTADRRPTELDGLTDRLLDRFKWGVVEELPRPDFELRKKILVYKATKNGLDIDGKIIDMIAANVEGSVREIEGVVMGILTRSIANNAPITEQLALDVMSHTVKAGKQRSINFDMIVEATADFYKLNPDVIFSKSRVRDIADARQLIMYLADKHTKLSSTAIGAKLNRRHATVLYGIKAVADRISVSKEVSEAVALIEADLKKM